MRGWERNTTPYPGNQGPKKGKKWLSRQIGRGRAHCAQMQNDTPQTAKHDTLVVHCSVNREDLGYCILANGVLETEMYSVLRSSYMPNHCAGPYRLQD
jgi:hypothetical protein